MVKRHIDYGRLVEQALRTVVRDVLSRVTREGLNGSHHFYITFRTDDPEVGMADYLRQRYPGEMTIVLQYQFWDLQVDDDGFAVTLSFNNIPERLEVPFSAVKVFADPGAEFGLQFTIEPEDRVVAMPSHGGHLAAVAEPGDAAPQAAVPIPLRGEAAEAKPEAAKAESGATETAADPIDPAEPDDAEDRPGAEIVALDRFRKK